MQVMDETVGFPDRDEPQNPTGIHCDKFQFIDCLDVEILGTQRGPFLPDEGRASGSQEQVPQSWQVLGVGNSGYQGRTLSWAYGSVRPWVSQSDQWHPGPVKEPEDHPGNYARMAGWHPLRPKRETVLRH